MKKSLKCFCCGKEYDLCPHCPTDVSYAPWRTMHCCIEHFKLFELAQDYRNGMITKTEAREFLDRNNFSGCERFETQTGAVIREIMTGNELTPAVMAEA